MGKILKKVSKHPLPDKLNDKGTIMLATAILASGKGDEYFEDSEWAAVLRKIVALKYNKEENVL